MKKTVMLILLACLLTAGDGVNLMPLPWKIKFQEGKFRLSEGFALKVEGPFSPRVKLARLRFFKRLSGRTGLFLNPEAEGDSMILLYQKHIPLSPEMDESYVLRVGKGKILVKASTDIGILRGLETLLQLLSADEDGYFFPAVQIEDHPRFPWRGLLIDVVRHFMPMEVLKRNIDAMAAVKMNVLHLHLTDDQGFRIESKVYPRLHQVASDGNYFTQEEIKKLIKYADLRGIRVVPEFDVPAHTTSWLVAYPALGTLPGPYKKERNYGTPDPVMDPTKKLVYKFLDRFFREMARLFPDPYIHIGGDEVNGVHWGESRRVAEFMRKHHMESFEELQAYFNLKINKILKKHGKAMVGWDEILNPALPRNVVIQSWRGRESLYSAVKQGFYAILSSGFYIDLCQPTSFHYLNDPLWESQDLTPEEKKRVLGGEATMWAELVSPETVDSRIWPRTAAIAERLWSSPEVRDLGDMYRRLGVVSQELEELGITHIKNQGMMLRRLAGYGDPGPLEVLVALVQPIQVYKRHEFHDYTVFSPLTRFVDASVPDPPFPREFSSLVDAYLKGDGAAEERLKTLLTLWVKNHEGIVELSRFSPVVKEILPLSESLSRLAALALQAMEMRSRGEAPDKEWLEAGKALLEKAREPVAEVELLVVSPLEKLILSPVKN